MRALALALALLGLAASSAAAQLEEDLIPAERSFVSPESFILELRVGPYTPDFGDDNDAFDTFFGEDVGPLLEAEVDIIAYRLPEILYVTGGGRIGWSAHDGRTLDESGQPTSEETGIEMVPLTLLATGRVDILPRKLSIPLIFTGKVGYQWMHWSTSSGGQDDENGWSLGLVYGLQVALDLDTFEPSKARILDEEWGVNHSFLFFEMLGFAPTSGSLPLGDLTWTAGLGFVI